MIVTQSVTQAQRMQSILRRAGIYSRIVRGHRAIMENGCGYTLSLSGNSILTALEALRQAGTEPGRIYRRDGGRYQEVIL